MIGWTVARRQIGPARNHFPHDRNVICYPGHGKGRMTVLPEQIRTRSPISQQFYQRQTPGIRRNVKCRGSWRRRGYPHVADRAGGWISGLPVWVSAGVEEAPDQRQRLIRIAWGKRAIFAA